MQNARSSRIEALAVALACHALVVAILFADLPTRTTQGTSRGAAGDGGLMFVTLTPAPTQPPATRHTPDTPDRVTIAQSSSTQAITDTKLRLPTQTTTSSDIMIGEAPDGLADAELSFRERLYNHIAQFRHYPEALKAKHVEGRVVVEFVMSRKGAVLDVWISRSSGNLDLDKAAIETILRAQLLPAIPGELPGPMQIALPVEFASRS